jgi:hypothetical protein
MKYYSEINTEPEMQDKPQMTADGKVYDRWTLIRDIAVLQFKLIVDGLRDFVLIPASLIAGAISLFKSGPGYDNEFYELLRVGKKSEHWINLFGAVEHAPDLAEDRVRFPEDDIDALVTRVESFVVDEYRKGGVTKQAKDQLDQLLAAVNRRRKRRSGDDEPRE